MPRSKEADLSVQIEAKVDKLEKQMLRANALAEKGFRQMERRTQDAAAKMETSMAKAADGIGSKFAAFGKGAFAGIGAGLAGVGVSAVVQGFREIATGVAEIGNQAKRAGLSTKAFQELSFVATQSRIPIDALTDGMKELSLRADEFITTGTGSAAEAFRRIGFSATDLKAKLKDPSNLLVEIVGKLQRLDKAAQIRIADELFGGTGGERFVEILDQGSAGIKQMIQDANDFGLVIDEKMIAKADEIDRKFTLLATTVSTRLKSAILEATDALGDFLDKFRATENQGAETLRGRIAANFQKQADYRRQLADYREQGVGRSPMTQNLETELRLLEHEYSELQASLDRYTGLTDTAGGKVDRLGTAADNAAAKLGAMSTAAGSPRQAETASMAALGRFNDAQARTISKKGMLDLIGYAEGTDKGRGYNETLAFGKFTGGDRNLTAMTLKEILALQKQMLAHPDNKFNSSALGRYQIVGTTLKGLIKDMGLTGDEFFTPAMQDRFAEQLLRRRGGDLGGLLNEWEGLRRVPDGAISTALGVTQPAMAPRDEGAQAAIDQKKGLADSYREIVNGSVEMIANQNAEASAIGMTALQAAKLRYEPQLLNQASQAGITLTPQQRAELSQLAAGMAEVEMATAKASATQEQMRDAQQFLKQGVGGFFQSIISGSATAEQALQRLLGSLADAALEAALMGTGPLGGLFGGAGTGNAAGGILGALFGFKDGGIAAHGRPLPTFAKGGVSRSAAIFGEAGPEAAVPLPDGRRIPVDLKMAKMPANANAAGSVSYVQNLTIAPTITVNAAQGGDQKANDDAARRTAKAIDDQIRATVTAEIVRAMRPGGIMRNRR